MKENRIKETTDDELKDVSGGNEPEEFDWKAKGYVTPEKDHTEGNVWKFEAIGSKEEKLKRLRENENN